MGKLLVDIDREALERVRVKLGARSHAEALRKLIVAADEARVTTVTRSFPAERLADSLVREAREAAELAASAEAENRAEAAADLSFVGTGDQWPKLDAKSKAMKRAVEAMPVKHVEVPVISQPKFNPQPKPGAGAGFLGPR